MKVLLVDDDARLTATLSRGLAAENVQVEVALDGTDGLWRAREGRYDVIVLDLMLPGTNGYEVCAQLREDGNHTPVLMLTAMDDALDEAHGLDVGADDYLRKPFSFVVLVARLHALVRRAVPSTSDPIDIGDLTVGLRRRTVRRGATSIELTSREFDVLSYLARHSGEVVSKRELLDAVWDDHAEIDPNVVEVYLARLRRKVDAPFDVCLLHTVRGAGYRLDAS